MASSSKEGLIISDTSNLLDSNEIIDKLLDSDDSEFSDTDESSDTDFIEQEDDAMSWTLVITVLWVITACVSDNGFLWGGREMFSGISRPQDGRLIL